MKGGGTRLFFAIFTRLAMAVRCGLSAGLFIKPLVTCPFLFVLSWPYQKYTILSKNNTSSPKKKNTPAVLC